MWAQYDKDKKKYVLLEYFVDWKKDQKGSFTEVSEDHLQQQNLPKEYNGRMVHLLSVEGRLYLLGEVIQYQRVASGTDSGFLCGS